METPQRRVRRRETGQPEDTPGTGTKRRSKLACRHPGTGTKRSKLACRYLRDGYEGEKQASLQTLKGRVRRREARVRQPKLLTANKVSSQSSEDQAKEGFYFLERLHGYNADMKTICTQVDPSFSSLGRCKETLNHIIMKQW